MSLSFRVLMAYLNRAISAIPDPRRPSNNQRYSLPSVRLLGVFDWVYQTLRQAGWLKPYEVLGGHLLIALDGTQYSA
jgi:hypothetical protein